MAQQTRAAVVAAGVPALPTLNEAGRVRPGTLPLVIDYNQGVAAGALGVSVGGYPTRGDMLTVPISTAFHARVFMRSSSTGLGLAGLTLAVNLCKAGQSGFSSVSPTVTDLSGGWYDLSFASGNADTLGEAACRITAGGAFDNNELLFDVVAVNKTDGVRYGLTALPNAAAGQAGGLSQAVIRGGTAQGAGTGSNQIQLDASASSTDNLYNRHRITIVSNTGIGQTRFIISYVGSTKTATVGRNWTTPPDNTSVFEITQDTYNILAEGLAQAGATSSITLKSTESTVTDNYKGTWIHIVSGTGAGQSRLVTGYNSSTKVATVDTAWGTGAVPDSTSGYQILEGADVYAVNQAVSANVTEWLGSAPAALDGSGNVPADVQAWRGSTPNNLSSGLVEATVDGSIVVTNVNVVEWLGATPAALDGSGNVPANIQAVANATAVAGAVLDAARSGHLTLGTVGEGIALAASLLQGNFFIDNVTPSANGPTAQRIRCWTSASAMSGVTPGGSGQGEFATFSITTTYTGPGAYATHKVVQQ